MRTETQQRSPQQKICGYEYTVKRGDSFYLIAQRLGVPLRDLLEANSEVNPARLMVGDVLCIPMEEDDAVTKPAQEPTPQQTKPAPPPAAQVPAEQPAPAAEPGADEAPAQAELTVTVEEVVLNAMPDVPQTACAPSASDAAQSDASAAEPQPIPVPEGSIGYTVAAGDTAAEIVQAADISLKTLADANPGVDLEALQAGERINVPTANKPCTTTRFYRISEGGNLEAVALQLDVSVSALLRANPCLAPSDFKSGTVVSVP